MVRVLRCGEGLESVPVWCGGEAGHDWRDTGLLAVSGGETQDNR